ncbi:cytochrome c family protein [Sphingomonas sp.]|uniref:c-type cytochrome n=1 Tax=Sphingomonas sp. TaxID=28214 RepID=UPI001B03B546|nr:cytochrome c family protein [Sphingomonas sp.]MBO9714194.1 cytochrome c family protein [Sphingomonas sp.]
MSKTNTFVGWVLAGGVAALGLSIASGMVFKAEPPEKFGYPVEAEEATEGGAVAVAPLPVRLAAADPAKGAESFKKCAACHTIAQGAANGIGPNLWGTLGEPIGQGKGGFAFSDALKGVGGNWDFDKMDHWLTKPSKFAAGTKMTFAGLPDPQERANVIAYLNSQGSNLAYPAVAAEAGAPAGNEAAGNATEGNAAEPAAAGNETTPKK